MVTTNQGVIPAGSIVFSGRGESGGMRYVSTAGQQFDAPFYDPQPGDGTSAILSLPTTGALAVVGGNDPNFGATGIGTFNPNGSVSAAYAGASFAGRGGCSYGDYFYAAKRLTTTGRPIGVFQYDASASLVASWSIGYGGGAPSDTYTVQSMAVVGTTAYVMMTYGSSIVVRRYSLAGAGSYLDEPWVAATPSWAGENRLLGLADGTVVFANPSTQAVQRYNAAFTTVQRTYTYTGAASMQLAAGYEADEFWVSGTATAPTNVVVSMFSSGASAAERSFTITGGGFAWDGPFAVLQQNMSSLVEDDIRWLRRSPHAVNELKRVMYHRMDLLMDVGVGESVNPTLYLRKSDDGGQTWSTARAASFGSANQTTKRVFWTRLGSGRDRVFEVYGDASAPVRLVDAYLEVTPGKS